LKQETSEVVGYKTYRMKANVIPNETLMQKQLGPENVGRD
jgi:hypothetical protein